MNRSGRSRRSTGELLIQDSKLLKLPAELRNLVYEYAAQNTQTVTYRENNALYVPDLSLVCHQIRDEYRQIYLDEAPKYAAKLNVNITNFITSTKAGDLRRIHDHLPEPSLGIERQFTVRVIVTNFWDRYRLELRNFIDHGIPLEPKPNLELVWDRKTFDTEFWRENVQRLRFCFARSAYRNHIWPQFEKALEEALERYAPPKQAAAKRKWKKTKNDLQQPVRKKPRRSTN